MLLNIDELHVHYGRLAAVRGISLQVDAGEKICIVGPNGAGKSSTLLAVAGAVPVSQGRVTFAGRDINGLKPELIARLGFSMVPEGRHVFSSLTVLENLRVGTGTRRDRRAVAQDIERVLEYFPVLHDRKDSPAGRLSGGEQQMLVIGRALLTNPRLIAIDEPALGLAPKIISRIYEILADLVARNDATLLIVEQSLERAIDIADRIYVLRSGKIELSGSQNDLPDRRRIEEAYFGFVNNSKDNKLQ